MFSRFWNVNEKERYMILMVIQNIQYTTQIYIHIHII